MSHPRPRILVIDRSSGYHGLIRFALEAEFDVEHAYSGFLAEVILRERSFDVIIASLSLPREYRGTGMRSAIRAIDGYARTPVIALLAEGARFGAGEADDFAACIDDPSRIEDVRTVVRSALTVRQAA